MQPYDVTRLRLNGHHARCHLPSEQPHGCRRRHARAGQGSAARRGAALRHLRLRPPRPRARRRARRGRWSSPATTTSCARTRRSCSATSCTAWSPSTDPARRKKLAVGTPVVSLPLLRNPGSVDTTRPVRQGARCVRRAPPHPGEPDAQGPQRARRRRRSADRADGSRLACRRPRRRVARRTSPSWSAAGRSDLRSSRS